VLIGYSLLGLEGSEALSGPKPSLNSGQYFTTSTAGERMANLSIGKEKETGGTEPPV
jgi:hypothetical protein